MRCWYVLAKRFGPPIGNNVDPRHLVSCDGRWCSPTDCTWEHVRVGDRVALVRTRERLNYVQKYTPGLLAFGTIVHTCRGRYSPRQHAYIVYDDLLFDRPISLSRLASLPGFQPDMFFRTAGRCADRPPGPLSNSQWNVLQEEKGRPRRIAPKVRWTAQPGDRVDHDQIGIVLGTSPGNPDERRRSRLVGWNVELEGRPDQPTVAVRVCADSPNIFITGTRADNNVLPDPVHIGGVLVSTSDRDAVRLANHVSAGVALRLFALEDDKSSSIYAGQYVIDQANPVVEDPLAGMPAGTFCGSGLWITC